MKVSLTEIQLYFHPPSCVVHPCSFVSSPPSEPLVVALFTAALALAAVLLVALLIAAVVIVVAAAARHKKSSGAPLDLVGRTGTVERDLNPVGAVLVGGELFPARTRAGERIGRAEGARVRVVGARGHLLEVERAE